ncbi:hypothetical protein J0910_10160 [Nocardiopsis sp. CNT-189]|uniref:hypothetical protein n=1 Tax=Nocardiopsis oceanisediminis TaxID=2816862 RepID=UPI003B3084F2
MSDFEPGPGVFTEEWEARAPGERRSLPRMAALLRELGDPQDAVPVLGVVGSKGKGTAAAFASARLAAAGLRVVTVTGPSHRSHRERIRVDGRAVPGERLEALAARISAARDRLPAAAGGYLGPNGLFLAAGLLEAVRTGADVCVLEAGMGGRRDELSLTGPRVVALSSVFAEHIGVLGDTPAEIAAEKAGVCGPRTEAFVHLPQDPGPDRAMRAALREACAGRVAPEQADPASGAPGLLAPGLRPAGLSASSAVLGHAAAERMLRLLGRDPSAGDPARTAAVLGSVRLPGRLSHHRIGAARLIVDSAIDRTGIRAALEHARAHWPRVDHVLLCFPDHKDVPGAITELAGLPVTAADLPLAHLHFDRELPPHWHRVHSTDLTPASVAALGDHVLALGTVYFAARLLTLAGADTELMFDAGAR